MRQTYKGKKKPLHYYLWAPINQYVPLTHKAFPIRPPVFSPECLKWVLRPCRGNARRPLLKPCTYWAPMHIRRPECGYVPKQQYKMVNYRTPMFIPGNCPCVWPCTRRFDHIQRCRIKVEKHEQKMDRMDMAGDPALDTVLKIQENYAYQLCRSMSLAMSSNTLLPIGWIPIRVENLKPNQQITSGRNYYGISKRETGNETSKVIPKIKRITLKDKTKHKRGHHHHHKHHHHRHHHHDELKKHTLPDELEVDQNILQRKKRDIDNGIDDNGDGEQGVLFISFDPETHDDDPDESENVDGNGGGNGGGSPREGGNNAGYVGKRCPMWHYKSCGRSLPPEDLVSAEGDHEKPGTSIETDTVEDEEETEYFRRKRRVRVRREEDDVDPSVAASLTFSFDEGRSYKEGEGSFETEDPIESGISSEGGEGGVDGGSGSPSKKNSSDANGGGAREICNEWYVTEEDCMPETPVTDTKGTAGRNAYDDKEVVKDICPGGADFPCFLRRKKRDTSEDILLIGQQPHLRPFTNHNNYGPFKKHEKEKQHNKRTRRSEDDKESVSVESSSHSSSIENDDDYDSYESHLRRQKKSEMDSRKIFVNRIRFRKDTSCRCDWPCLPFYDAINKCYDDNGRLLVNSAGKPVVIHRSYRKYQRDPVVCINFADSDEIFCKIKSNPVRNSQRIVPYV
ncbi:unnamed protein product [Orchesella dallaii]|uniref:Uncharacterized protein n=1 Tax=Orchesella dallaii TaxID=48710 RepID=A0ABP1QKT9_9HEXA